MITCRKAKIFLKERAPFPHLPGWMSQISQKYPKHIIFPSIWEPTSVLSQLVINPQIHHKCFGQYGLVIIRISDLLELQAYTERLLPDERGGAIGKLIYTPGQYFGRVELQRKATQYSADDRSKQLNCAFQVEMMHYHFRCSTV